MLNIFPGFSIDNEALLPEISTWYKMLVGMFSFFVHDGNGVY